MENHIPNVRRDSLIEILPRGKFSQLYAGRNNTNQSELIVLKKVMIPDRHNLREIEKELNLLKRNAERWNEHVLKVIEFYMKSAELWVVMSDFCINLETILSEFPATTSELYQLAFKCTKAITYLHDQKIAHGNLKPTKILVSASHFRAGHGVIKSLKVGDPMFGFYINKGREHQERASIFLAPELKKANSSSKPEQSSDIFSLGIIFLWSFSQTYTHVALPGNYETELLSSTGQVTLANMPKWQSKTTESLKKMVNQMCQENPQDRKPARDVKDNLEKIWKDELQKSTPIDGELKVSWRNNLTIKIPTREVPPEQPEKDSAHDHPGSSSDDEATDGRFRTGDLVKVLGNLHKARKLQKQDVGMWPERMDKYAGRHGFIKTARENSSTVVFINGKQLTFTNKILVPLEEEPSTNDWLDGLVFKRFDVVKVKTSVTDADLEKKQKAIDRSSSNLKKCKTYEGIVREYLRNDSDEVTVEFSLLDEQQDRYHIMKVHKGLLEKKSSDCLQHMNAIVDRNDIVYVSQDKRKVKSLVESLGSSPGYVSSMDSVLGMLGKVRRVGKNGKIISVQFPDNGSQLLHWHKDCMQVVRSTAEEYVY